MTASTTVQSNASNFGDYLSAGVDPRTGHFMASVNLPQFGSSDLVGPTLPLTLSYNLLNKQNQGFGVGWSLNLSRYSPANHHVLSLNTGETFRIDEAMGIDKPARIDEQKVESFHFHAANLSDGPYQVVHRSGQVEYFSQYETLDGPIAVPTRVQNALGHAVALEYSLNSSVSGLRLTQVLDDNGEVLLSITYYADRAVVRLAPQGDSQYTRLDFIVEHDRLARVEVDGIADAQWTFGYQNIRGYDCIVTARTPQGTVEYMEYDDEGHVFPGPSTGTKPPALPRVTSHRLYPGKSMPAIETTWAYSTNNYLGYGGTDRAWVNDGTDQLYAVTTASFRYQTIVHMLEPDDSHLQTLKPVALRGTPRRALRTITRTYNRFHQMLEQETEQAGCKLIEAVKYYTDDSKSFRDQPPYFQLPEVREIRWEHPGGTRSEQTKHRYDTHANPVWQVGPDGVVTEYEYYPREGETGACPPEPNGFPNALKCQRTLPAEQAPGSAPVRQTLYRYTSLQPLTQAGTTGLIALEETRTEHVQANDVTVLGTDTTYYHDTPDDPLLHGRVRQLEEATGDFVSTTSFAYSVTGASVQERAITTEVRVFGHNGKGGKGIDPSSTRAAKVEFLSTYRTIACLTGTVLESRDSDGVIQRSTYDTLNRVTSQTLDGPSPATRQYRYRFAGVSGSGAGNDTVSIDVNGVEVTNVADGLGRAVEVYRSLTSDERGDLLECHAYNALGQRIEHIQIDDYGTQPQALVSTFEYDAWGNPSRVIGPDGVVTVTEVSLTPLAPAASILRSWQEHPDASGQRLGESLTHYNLFGKVSHEARYSPDGDETGRLDYTNYTYDGLGRCIEQTRTTRDLANEHSRAYVSRTTTYAYDLWDRVVSTKRPDQSEVVSTFAPFNRQVLVTDLTVRHSNTSIVAGQQRFDRFGRRTEQRHGNLVERLDYAPGSLRIATRTLPGGEQLAYEYEPSLAATPTRIIGSLDTQTFSYDQHTGLVTGATAGQGATEFVYNRLGEVEHSVLKAPGFADHTTSFTRSRQGRRLSRSDDSAAPSQHEYDQCGRLLKTLQAGSCVTHAYNALGLLTCLTTDGPAGQALNTREYDGLGRETVRRVQLPGVAEYVITQRWGDDDLLLIRRFESEGKLQLEERFEYDAMNQLSSCTYQGEAPWLPTDRFGSSIAEEWFTFDELGNITLATTVFVGGSYVDAEHVYDSINRSQLVRIDYQTDDARYPAQAFFAYDHNGCMTNDSSANLLRYDERGRLVGIETSTGMLRRRYHYDPHDELLGSTDSAGADTRYFYDNLALNHTQSPGGSTQYLYAADGHAVVEHDLGTHSARLLATDPNGSVRGTMGTGGLLETGYDAWGSANGPLASTLGYNGERHDDAFDGYLLGRGYRAYLPRLRRFNAPDSASPFDGGGLNPYAYAAGNPIVFHDPTGHFATRVAGPARIQLPKPEPERQWWQRWIPVGIGVLTSVIFTLVFPPATAAAWALVLGTSAASTTWGTLVALEKVEDNTWINLALMIADFGAEPLAAKLAGKAAANAGVDAATNTASTVGTLTRRSSATSTNSSTTIGDIPISPAGSPTLELSSQDMEVFKLFPPATPPQRPSSNLAAGIFSRGVTLTDKTAIRVLKTSEFGTPNRPANFPDGGNSSSTGSSFSKNNLNFRAVKAFPIVQPSQRIIATDTLGIGAHNRAIPVRQTSGSNN